MKKRFFVALAAAMSLSLASVPVMAADFLGTSSQQAEVIEVIITDGNLHDDIVVDEDDDDDDESYAEILAEIEFERTVAAPLASGVDIEGAEVSAITDAAVIASANEAAAEVGGAVEKVFELTASTSGDFEIAAPTVANGNFAVLIQNADGSWAKVPCTKLPNGKLKINLKSVPKNAKVAIVNLDKSNRSPRT